MTYTYQHRRQHYQASKVICSTLLLLVLHCQLAVACKCSSPPLMERIANVDFIATAKIIDIAPDQSNPDYHEIEISIIDHYKGPMSTKLSICSTSTSSCKFYTPKNSTWLIFAKRNANGVLSFGRCSGALQIDKEHSPTLFPNENSSHSESADFKLEILNYLKAKKLTPSNHNIIARLSNECEHLLNDVIFPKRLFALYELTINKDLSIDSLKTIKKMGHDNLDIDLTKCIKQHLIVNAKNHKIESTTQIIVGIYYYPPRKGSKGFITVYDL